ncbi:MAG TPA: hypothetical protein VF739_03330 [Ktedonobacterales bacterium]
MSQEDRVGLLFLGYFALIVGAGVGVFARGATALATLLVIALGGAAILLLALAAASASRDDGERLSGD